MAAEGPAPEVAYGGQAVIEGVMIRSPRYVSVACRWPRPDGSHGGFDTPIDIHTEAVRSIFARYPRLRRVPLVRGVFALFEMLGIGLRTLERSGNIQAQFAQLLAPLLTVESEPPSHDGKGALNGPLMWGTIAVSFTIGIALFVLLPNWIADLVGRWCGFGEHSLALNLVEGLLRLLIFVGYIGLIGRLPDIRRVFQYHGAEHKVVNGHEAGLEPTLENVQQQSCLHPRCGTNFAFLTIVLSMLVFCFIPWTESLWPRLGWRIALLPAVAGIGFELLKFVGARRDQRWLQTLIAPGLWLQKLTTREPGADMIEVALASFTAVRLAEETGVLTCVVREPARPAETAHE